MVYSSSHVVCCHAIPKTRHARTLLMDDAPNGWMTRRAMRHCRARDAPTSHRARGDISIDFPCARSRRAMAR
jgi:hypothetical protein